MTRNFRLLFATLCLITISMTQSAYAQLTGTYILPGTVAGNTVNNLSQLATLLNSSTVTGTAIFEFTSSYTTTGEVLPIVFNSFGGAGNVIIRPAAAVSTPLVTSGAPASQALISLSGVKNITFDGRSGGIGTGLNWQFHNTGSNSSYPVFLFINGAQYDALKYLTVQGSGTTSTGNINFSTSSAGGNSYDTIANCNVTSYAAYAYIQIYSNGTAGVNANSNNSIIDNNISNFRSGTGSSMPTQGGIIVTTTGNGSNWNISRNSIYCTGAPYAYSTPLGAVSFGPGTTSTGNIISGNYIGGQQPLCGGSMMKVMSYQANGYPDFNAIYNSSGSVMVSNNTIKNIYMGSSTGSSTFCGINISGSGSAQVRKNIVGSSTDTNNIVSGLNGTMLGIYNHSSGGVVNIDSNIVANLTSNYRAFISGSSSQTPGAISGIYNYGGSGGNIGATTITNNQVFNLTTASNYNYNQYFYINSSGNNGSTFPSSIYNNPQNNIVCGIFMEQDNTNTNTQVISKNTIYGLSTTISGGSSIAYISGIVANGNTGGTNIINGNQVYGLYAPNTFGTSGTYFIGLNGIYLPTFKAGKYFIQDNIIHLGLRPNDGSSVQNAQIYGIWENNYNMNSPNLKEYIYHNSVYIGGSDNSSVYSYAFARSLKYSSTAYDSMVIMNNIFVNNRTSTNASSRAYGLYLNSTINVQSNYNDIYGTGTYFYYGAANGTSYLTRTNYLAGVPGFETNGINADPQYVSATTATPNLHISNSPSLSPIDQAGTATYTITYDYDSLIRANFSPVDLGATVSCSASPVSVTLSASDDTICPGSSVTFTATGVNGGTPLYNFYLNGVSVQNGASNSFTISLLANNDSLKVKITGNSPCASVDTAFSSAVKIIVNSSSVVPSVSISPSQTSICSGTSVTFTATPFNQGSAPSYNFIRNGISVQNSAANTYTTTTLSSADSVWVILTSNASCVSSATATSSKIHITVTTMVTPTVSVSASGNSVCAGSAVTFTASATPAGGTPTFNFIKNGVSVQNSTATTYSSSSLNNNDSIWVILTTNTACVTTTTATSTKIRMVINAIQTPSVTISASQNNVCAGTSITFTASAISSGTTPTYNFFLNGLSMQNGSSTTYTSTAIQSNDSLWVIVTSNAACVSAATATSAKVHMTISATIAPTVTVTASQNNICAGISVNFTANFTGGGTAPALNFFKNGVSVQNGAATTYITATLNNGDSIWVVMTSNSPCASPVTATSSKVRMTIIATITPTIAITASANNVCTGTTLTFTASATNPGLTPTYNFYKNGVSVQNGTGAAYSSSTLAGNDSVWVILTSNATCASPATVTSSKVHVVINPTVTPSVSLAASQNNVCAATQVIFTATGTNPGGGATYNFYKNGISVQNSTSTTYSTTTLNQNDSIWVVLTSNAACASPTTATSAKIGMVIHPAVNPAVTISASQNNICPGTSVTFTAAGSNPGGAPIYRFYVNGTIAQAGASNTYATTTLTNGTTVKVVLISNAACRSIDSATSATVTMIVSSTVTPGVSLTPTAISICAGASTTFTATGTGTGSLPSYNFFINGVSVQNGAGNTYNSIGIQNNDSVWVVLTSSSPCASPLTATSTKSRVTVTVYQTPSVSLTASQNNICAGTAVTYTATGVSGGSSPSYRFYVNGTSVQNGSLNTYNTSTLANNDIVRVIMTSNYPCRTIDTALSSTISMVVNTTVAPTISIIASSTNICTGTPVTFSTSTTGQGASPQYTFFVNGTAAQSGSSSSYSTTTSGNNDSVWVVMTSNAACASPTSVTSSKVRISVSTASAPTISISASQNNICANTTVTFTATGNNTGSAPSYNFYLNGTSVQNGLANTYTSSNIQNGDSVWVIMSSNAPCASPSTAQSSKLRMTVLPAALPTISLFALQNNVCAGTTIFFNTTANNTGTGPLYNFYVNGVSVQSGVANTWSSAMLHSNDSVWVVLTSNLPCASPVTVTSSKVHVTIIPLVTPTTILTASDTNLCPGEVVNFTTVSTSAGTTPTYQFLVNGISVQNGTNNAWSSNGLTNNANVKVILTSDIVCAALVSDSVGIRVYQAASTNITGAFCTGHSYQFAGRTLTQAGTYYDTLNTIHGCDSAITLQLRVTNTVSVQISDSICKGSSYNFHGRQLSQSGVYTDTLIAAGGCDSIVILHLSIAAEPNALIVQLGRDTLTTGQFTSYQWLRNSNAITGANGQRYIAQQSGTYTVVVTNGAGCRDTAATFGYTASGISEQTQASFVKLYPNPTSGELYIQLDGNMKSMLAIKIYNIQGQAMVTQDILSKGDNIYILDIGKYAAGIYYIQIQTEGGSEMHKVDLIR